MKPLFSVIGCDGLMVDYCEDVYGNVRPFFNPLYTAEDQEEANWPVAMESDDYPWA